MSRNLKEKKGLLSEAERDQIYDLIEKYHGKSGLESVHDGVSLIYDQCKDRVVFSERRDGFLKSSCPVLSDKEWNSLMA